MRLFVALEVPRNLRDELAKRARDVRADLPKVRWVRPEAMHLTLAFLGETDEGLLPALDRELEPATATVPSFELRLHGLGALPPRGKARVLWAGFAAAGGRRAGGRRSGDPAAEAPEPPARLAELQKAVTRAVRQAAGIEPDRRLPERRPFRPHLTLARLRPPWGRGSVERFLDAFGELPAEVFRIAEGVLFSSVLHPSGARYQALRRYRLADDREEVT